MPGAKHLVSAKSRVNRIRQSCQEERKKVLWKTVDAIEVREFFDSMRESRDEKLQAMGSSIAKAGERVGKRISISGSARLSRTRSVEFYTSEDEDTRFGMVQEDEFQNNTGDEGIGSMDSKGWASSSPIGGRSPKSPLRSASNSKSSNQNSTGSWQQGRDTRLFAEQKGAKRLSADFVNKLQKSRDSLNSVMSSQVQAELQEEDAPEPVSNTASGLIEELLRPPNSTAPGAQGNFVCLANLEANESGAQQNLRSYKRERRRNGVIAKTSATVSGKTAIPIAKSSTWRKQDATSSRSSGARGTVTDALFRSKSSAKVAQELASSKCTILLSHATNVPIAHQNNFVASQEPTSSRVVQDNPNSPDTFCLTWISEKPFYKLQKTLSGGTRSEKTRLRKTNSVISGLSSPAASAASATPISRSRASRLSISNTKETRTTASISSFQRLKSFCFGSHFGLVNAGDSRQERHMSYIRLHGGAYPVWRHYLELYLPQACTTTEPLVAGSTHITLQELAEGGASSSTAAAPGAVSRVGGLLTRTRIRLDTEWLRPLNPSTNCVAL